VGQASEGTSCHHTPCREKIAEHAAEMDRLLDLIKVDVEQAASEFSDVDMEQDWEDLVKATIPTLN
jgi:hypothetical protein